MGGHGNEVGAGCLGVIQDLLGGPAVPHHAAHLDPSGGEALLDVGQVAHRLFHRAHLCLGRVPTGEGVGQRHPQQHHLCAVEPGHLLHLA
jgi:hypothetical protein